MSHRVPTLLQQGQKWKPLIYPRLYLAHADNELGVCWWNPTLTQGSAERVLTMLRCQESENVDSYMKGEEPRQREQVQGSQTHLLPGPASLLFVLPLPRYPSVHTSVPDFEHGSGAQAARPHWAWGKAASCVQSSTSVSSTPHITPLSKVGSLRSDLNE